MASAQHSIDAKLCDTLFRVLKIAKKLQDEGLDVSFAISSKADFSHELNEFGVATSGDKPVVAARNAADQKFVMSDEFRYAF